MFSQRATHAIYIRKHGLKQLRLIWRFFFFADKPQIDMTSSRSALCDVTNGTGASGVLGCNQASFLAKMLSWPVKATISSGDDICNYHLKRTRKLCQRCSSCTSRAFACARVCVSVEGVRGDSWGVAALAVGSLSQPPAPFALLSLHYLSPLTCPAARRPRGQAPGGLALLRYSCLSAVSPLSLISRRGDVPRAGVRPECRPPGLFRCRRVLLPQRASECRFVSRTVMQIFLKVS